MAERVKFNCSYCKFSTGWVDDSQKRWQVITEHWDKEHKSKRGFKSITEREIESPFNIEVVEI